MRKNFIVHHEILFMPLYIPKMHNSINTKSKWGSINTTPTLTCPLLYGYIPIYNEWSHPTRDNMNWCLCPYISEIFMIYLTTENPKCIEFIMKLRYNFIITK